MHVGRLEREGGVAFDNVKAERFASFVGHVDAAWPGFLGALEILDKQSSQPVTVRRAQETAGLRLVFLVFVLCHGVEQVEQVACLPIGEDEFTVDAYRFAVIVSVLQLDRRSGCDHLLQEAV